MIRSVARCVVRSQIRHVIRPMVSIVLWTGIQSRPPVSRAVRALVPRLMLARLISRRVLPVLHSIQHRADEFTVGKAFALSRLFRRPLHRVRLDRFDRFFH